MKYEHINEIKGIIVLAIGLILLASLISFVPEDLPWYTSVVNVPVKNWIRISGAYLSGSLLFIFGYSAYTLVLFLLFWSWNKFAKHGVSFSFSKFFSFIVLISVVSGLLSLTGSSEQADRFSRGGLIGLICADFLVQYFGMFGAYVILLMLCSLTLVTTGELLVSPALIKLTSAFGDIFVSIQGKLADFKSIWGQSAPKSKAKPKRRVKQEEHEYEEDEDEYEEDEDEYEDEEYEEYEDEEDDEEYEDEDEEYEDEEEDEEDEEPSIRIAEQKKVVPKEEKPKRVGEYHLPPLDLLEDSPDVSTKKVENNLVSGAKTLEATLQNFGVQAKVVDIERGPVITRYELQPAPGVKVQKFTNLSDDIALAMKAPSVRILAPVPGKSRVGIEVPNDSKASVYLKDVVTEGGLRNSDSKLTLSLGKDISGKPILADLADMPHLLVAGTTGAGKSVCINSIIMSILFNASPEEVKLLLVDPKMVEMVQYNDLPHCLCPTITDPKKVTAALNWVVSEMEARYKMLAKEGVKNIKGYHAKGLEMPYIVVIIDELADLMQVSAKTVESAIVRIAQLARAAGIHLILATQRPSVNVITGVIKANFSARISFKVASKVDSRTILDMNGGEDLLGKGDMLFMKPGVAKPIRCQCNFVSDEEIARVIDFIKAQQEPEYNDTITKQNTSAGGGAGGEKDELYEDARRLVVETGQASVSILQRRMRLGYTRAARLIDMMESEGIVGPYCGSKARELLVDREQWLLDNPVDGEGEE